MVLFLLLEVESLHLEEGVNGSERAVNEFGAATSGSVIEAWRFGCFDILPNGLDV